MADPMKSKRVIAEFKRIKDEHSLKTKSLMKSINKLKDELEKEKYQKQDNVRAKIIERMKKDIGDNETVIELMREIINDDDQIDKAIVKKLKGGIDRARVLSREELRMEIKRLNGELQKLKTQGVVRRKKKKVDNEEKDEDEQKLENSFEGLTFEHFKELKEQIDRLQAELESKQDELDKANDQIEELKEDKKVTGISLHSLMDRVKNMDSDKKAFEKVKIKLKEFKNQGIFKGIDLDVDEEEDEETVNLLNRLVKLIDKTKADIENQDKEYKEFKDSHTRKEQEREKREKDEIDGLVDEYNQRDDEFHEIEDKYIALKKDMKKKMYEVAKYKEELEELQEVADRLKEENKVIKKKDKQRIIDLEADVKNKNNKILELGVEIEELLQRTPTKSDTSTEFDSFALVKERKKVSKLTDEIKKLYDEIDKLSLKNEELLQKNRESAFGKIRSTSRERMK